MSNLKLQTENDLKYAVTGTEQIEHQRQQCTEVTVKANAANVFKKSSHTTAITLYWLHCHCCRVATECNSFRTGLAPHRKTHTLKYPVALCHPIGYSCSDKTGRTTGASSHTG